MRLKHDATLARSLLDVLSIPNLPVDQVLHTFRIGKFSVNLARPRPLKIILPDTISVSSVIQKFALVKRGANPPQSISGLLLISDKTPMQQQEYRKWKEELTRRNSEGEAGLKIVMRSGSYAIVRSSGPRRNLASQTSA